MMENKFLMSDTDANYAPKRMPIKNAKELRNKLSELYIAKNDNYSLFIYEDNSWKIRNGFYCSQKWYVESGIAINEIFYFINNLMLKDESTSERLWDLVLDLINLRTEDFYLNYEDFRHKTKKCD